MSVIIVAGVRVVANTFGRLVVIEDQTLFLHTILGMNEARIQYVSMLMSGETDVAIHTWGLCLLQDTEGRTRTDMTDAHGIIDGSHVPWSRKGKSSVEGSETR